MSHSAPPASPPEFARVAEATRLSGLSRSGLYREISNGNIVTRKHGKAVLIDMGSVRAFMASLPPAPIRPTPPRIA